MQFQNRKNQSIIGSKLVVAWDQALGKEWGLTTMIKKKTLGDGGSVLYIDLGGSHTDVCSFLSRNTAHLKFTLLHNSAPLFMISFPVSVARGHLKSEYIKQKIPEINNPCVLNCTQV